MANRMKALYNQVVFERRILLGCTALVGLSACIWAVAIGTDYWFTIEAPDGEGLPLGDAGATGRRLIYKHMGLWRGCVNGLIPKIINSTELVPYRECKYQDMFPPDSKFEVDPGLNKTVLNGSDAVDPKIAGTPFVRYFYRGHPKETDYARTQVSFAVISMFIMIMGFCFSIYTFRNPRYMFKRLAGGIHFISAACNMVVIQVLLSSIDFESKNVYETFPKGAIMRYDFSLVLAWIVFLCNLVAGCAFMLFSRKRKRDKAPTEEIAMADEPTIIGR